MNKQYLKIGALFGFLAVSFGAFGAHAFKELLEANAYQNTFETGVKFQFYHTFALLYLAFLSKNENGRNLKLSAYSFIIGIVLFSGSLYILSLSAIKSFGFITPIGGIFLLLGWAFLFFSKST